MANYYGTARSNYFKVKDLSEFTKALKDIEVEIVSPESDDGTVALLSRDADGAGWPTSAYNEARDEYEDIDLPALIAPHLEDGWVCVLMEVGNEKMRYLVGYADAFNNKGEAVHVSLNEIFDRAKAAGLGEHITDASW